MGLSRQTREKNFFWRPADAPPAAPAPLAAKTSPAKTPPTRPGSSGGGGGGGGGESGFDDASGNGLGNGGDEDESVASALTGTPLLPAAAPVVGQFAGFRKPLFGAVIGGADDYATASDPLKGMTVDQVLKHFRESR